MPKPFTRSASSLPSPAAPPPPHPFDPALLVGPGLLARVEHLHEIPTTMDVARQLAADATAVLPLAVVADRQTRGRGRRGAGWWQPPGSLAVSLVVEASRFTTSRPPATWSLAAGVALAESIRQLVPGVAAGVHWPNDVEVSGRKLAGILVEMAGGGRAIFGIGVNTTGSATEAPAALEHRVATLPDLTGRSLSRQLLLADFVPRLFALMTDMADMAADPGLLATRYQPLCCLRGRSVTLYVADQRHSGTCHGIAADGRLIVDTAAGRMLFASGSLTPPADVWHGQR